ncbi:hypothetical protein [Larkinella sp.]|uniref:hypothetical protein n=1 Tax=Larkinella sp. TaxID=2034517 RepID=UPI003BAC59EE
MSKSAKTVLYFSYYLFIIGLELTFIPNLFTKIAQLPDAHEPYIRVVGVLAFILGLYYYQAAKNDLTPLLKVTVLGRSIYFVAAVGFVFFSIAPPVFIAFGFIDLLGALWTGRVLKQEGKR